MKKYSKRVIVPEVHLMSWAIFPFSHTKTESRLLKVTLLLKAFSHGPTGLFQGFTR